MLRTAFAALASLKRRMEELEKTLEKDASRAKEKKLQIALIIILSVVGFVKMSNENRRKKSKMNIVRS